MAFERRLDLLGLDPKSPDLDLPVDAPAKRDAPVGKVAPEISGLVQTVPGRARERVLDEALRRQGFRPDVADGKIRAPDMDLARFLEAGHFALVLDDQELRAVDSPAERHDPGSRRGPGAVRKDEVAHRLRRFGGSVEIHAPRGGGDALQARDVGAGQAIAAEERVPQGGKRRGPGRLLS